MGDEAQSLHTADYLRQLGVVDLPALTSPFDPGYDPVTLEGHLDQSAHLISILKMSMSCWIVADESATRRKLESARRHRVPTVTGGGPFEIAVAQKVLVPYMDLCADLGVTAIECGEGFTDLDVEPSVVVRLADERGLGVQFELGKKHTGAFTDSDARALVDQGRRWLDAGASHLVVEARESAVGVGLFDESGTLDSLLADRLVEAFGLDVVVFEAPNKASQFAFIEHLGPRVRLSNVRLEELLRVEIFRRGLHSDAFSQDSLRPRPPGGSADGSR